VGEARELGAEELAAIEAAHRRWVETGGAEGERADLTGKDLTRVRLDGMMLQGAVLSRARLRGASLRRVDLVDAELEGTNLQGADLSGADLRRAVMRGAMLRDANLAEADLTGVRGLLSGQLGGANLAGSKLPEDLARFDGLVNVAEASRTTQGLFFSQLLVCAYAWLSVASTRDGQILNNAAPPSSRLPILGTDIPLVQFYVVAPLLLLCLFIYFHFCLQRLWEELGELPAVFPDGRALDKKAYPWLLNGIVRMHAPRLKESSSPLALWQARISVLLAWGLVPLTIAVMWVRYLRAHDGWVTGAQVLVLAGTVGVGVGFRRLAAATLRGSERVRFRWNAAWGHARARGWISAGVAAVVLGVLSYGAIEGVNPLIDRRGVVLREPAWWEWFDPRQWVPRVFSALGYNPFAHLDDVALSIKPANWTGAGTEAELESVRGADLERRNLRYGQAYHAFLVNAYARHADLSGADLRISDMRGVDLREARLVGANLRGAKLQKADLRWANLTGAKLDEGEMEGALLEGAILPSARLVRARLRGADLTSASLIEADLTEADLTGADLSEARLDGAKLAGADLRETVGLSWEQLKAAKLEETTRLPAELESLARVSAERSTVPVRE
jgi:uncharacterized protein YjbI with pentapeptide repeats